MNKIIAIVFLAVFIVSGIYSQDVPAAKLNGQRSGFDGTKPVRTQLFDKELQLKPRKTVTSYFGAGYSFIIFTASDMNKAYPVLNFSSGDFLSEINLFYGFAVAKAVTIEFEPSILFTRNNRSITIQLNQPVNGYSYVHPQTLSMLAFPLALNVRFFPFFKLTNYARLFFVGAGGGTVWIREEYDNYYNNNPGGIFFNENYLYRTESTSQWAPLFRIAAGFTGTGGAFGFGGEMRYNFVPLKHANDPFVTRYAPNFNSVDLALRFYFSL